MLVTVHGERCVGAGLCVLTAPSVFDQDEDGTATPLTDRIDPADEPAVRSAVRLCPSGALSLVDGG